MLQLFVMVQLSSFFYVLVVGAICACCGVVYLQVFRDKSETSTAMESRTIMSLTCVHTGTPRIVDALTQEQCDEMLERGFCPSTLCNTTCCVAATTTSTTTATTTHPITSKTTVHQQDQITTPSVFSFKIHACESGWFAFPIGILKRFGGVVVEEGPTLRDPDWDVQHGGYMHCGTTKHEWEYKTGLVPAINFAQMKPYQSWHQSFGMHQVLGNKREVCKLISASDQSGCYVLPKDRDRLEQTMSKTADQNLLWVLKRDPKNAQLHAGAGVSYIRKISEIPDAARSESGGYLVQPFKHPALGPGKFANKGEVRVYFAVTSLYPLRLYYYKDLWALIAATPYDMNNVNGNHKCMLDNHANTVNGCPGALKPEQRKLRYDTYAQGMGWTASQRDTFVTKATTLLSKIYTEALKQPMISRNPINLAINNSRATSYDFHRADLGVTPELDPVVYEINDGPWANEDVGEVKPICMQSQEDLFRMVALDQPRHVRATRKKEEYEREHLGGWIRLL